MPLKFKISGRIARPLHDVFEAVVDPDQLSKFFTTGGAKGRLETGATVTWDFADFPGAFPVEVVEVETDRRIVLQWQATDSADDPYEHDRDDGVRRPRRRTHARDDRRGGWRDTAAGQERRTATARAGPECSAR